MLITLNLFKYNKLYIILTTETINKLSGRVPKPPVIPVTPSLPLIRTQQIHNHTAQSNVKLTSQSNNFLWPKIHKCSYFSWHKATINKFIHHGKFYFFIPIACQQIHNFMVNPGQKKYIRLKVKVIFSLTCWPLGYMEVIPYMYLSNPFHELTSWSAVCHKTSLMVSQQWFR